MKNSDGESSKRIQRETLHRSSTELSILFQETEAINSTIMVSNIFLLQEKKKKKIKACNVFLKATQVTVLSRILNLTPELPTTPWSDLKKISILLYVSQVGGSPVCGKGSGPFKYILLSSEL